MKNARFKKSHFLDYQILCVRKTTNELIIVTGNDMPSETGLMLTVVDLGILTKSDSDERPYV